jgi:hypothetical protein
MSKEWICKAVSFICMLLPFPSFTSTRYFVIRRSICCDVHIIWQFSSIALSLYMNVKVILIPTDVFYKADYDILAKALRMGRNGASLLLTDSSET